MKHAHVLNFAIDHPWAITKPMLTVIANIIGRHVAGQKLTAEEIQAALVDRQNLPQPAGGAVAVIPIYGVIAPRMNLLSDFSGGTTFETLTGQLRTAMANKAIKTIVFDINSPGGSVAGATEFAREVMAARAKKTVIAQIQYTGASAAYWVAAAAGKIVAAPSALVGSIGVYTAHEDISAALEQLGVKRTYISAGKGKVDGNETEPLSPTALDRMTAMIDEAYTRFVGDVVKGRGKGNTAEKVRNEWQAHLYGASEALALGLIDDIATLDDTIARVMSAAPAEGRAAHLTVNEARALDNLPPLPDLDPTVDTAAGASRPPAQDRPSDASWQNGIAAELLSLDL
jgi:signal peptide peptidase SppA